jgi:tetratricopeptide (TPR) repeat protein
MDTISPTNPIPNSSHENEAWTLSFDIGDVWRGSLLFLATLFSHWQAIGGGFIWDDDAHVTKPALRSLQGLWDIWFKLGATQQYYPLVHSTFWLEHALWGDNASYYHIVNILLHAFACFLLVAVLKRIEIPGAWVAGFIFALHPVHVESVAWVTEQKNTISALFYLGAAYFYFKYDKERDLKQYGYAIGIFILALLSKTVTATLPAAMLVLFWWKRGRLSFKYDVIPLLPWFILGASGGYFTAWVERVFIGAQGADYQSAVILTPVTRVLLAGHVIWFYMAKLLWPANLIFIYEHWTLSASNVFDYIYTLGIIGLLSFLVRLAVKPWNGRPTDTLSRAPLAGFLFFCGTLFPVLGFANVYPFMFSYVADHFQYLASLGILVPIAAGLTLLVDQIALEHRGMGSAVGGVLLALLGFLSWNQCSMYKDGETLYRVTIERNPSCWMAHNNLGAILLNSGKQAEAQEQFEAALKIREGYPDAQSNECSVLIREGRFQEAIAHGEIALKLRESAENENNLAIALADVGRTSEAINHYLVALRIRPNYVEVLNNLGNAYSTLGKKKEALECYQTALKYMPNFADAYANIGVLYSGVGQIAEAIQVYEKAVSLNPNSAQFHGQLGLAYSNAGRHGEAIAQFQASLSLFPNGADIWFYLGNSLVALGKFAESEQPFLNAIRLNPNYIAAENNLASVYYRLGRLPEAINHYQMAIRLNPNYAEAHSNLGVSLAASKLIADAVSEYQKAVQLNPGYADAYNNLGLALANLNRNKESVEAFKTAIKINANNPDYYDNFARTLVAQGDKKAADEQIAIATKLRAKLNSTSSASANQSADNKAAIKK